jgi:protein farnesyltransferase subunit beta
MELLSILPNEDILNNVVDFLNLCQNEEGGFGGGPGQLSHLAPTYAAVNSLMICGTEKAYKCINRKKLYNFFLNLKNKKTGAFTMHKYGETDVRGIYCVLSVASLLNMLTPELLENIPEFISKCQTYEGGLGGLPGNEAHGGYTFCGLAALYLTGKTNKIDIHRLLV